MKCPFCGSENLKVVDSRSADDGSCLLYTSFMLYPVGDGAACGGDEAGRGRGVERRVGPGDRRDRGHGTDGDTGRAYGYEGERL